MKPPNHVGCCWFLCGVVVAMAAPAAPDPVESVEKTVAEWARIRAETVRLQSNWDWERELLHSTLTAMQDRLRGLEANRQTLEARTAGDRAALDELAARTAAANDSLKAADEHLRQVSAALAQLRPWLPPRLSQALELPFRSLADPKLSPGERMQFVTTVLNRCAQFNRSITQGEEVLRVAGGPDGKMLEVIYWGLSHGYALDREANTAYFGSPGPQGWAWEPAPGAAAGVVRLIAIERDQNDPEFVEVPARYTDVGPVDATKRRP